MIAQPIYHLTIYHLTIYHLTIYHLSFLFHLFYVNILVTFCLMKKEGDWAENGETVDKRTGGEKKYKETRLTKDI